MNTSAINPRKPAHDFIHSILALQEKHPYVFAFCIALAITLWILFYTRAIAIPDESMIPSDRLEFISIDEARNVAVRRISRSDVSVSKTDSNSTIAEVDRASGFSDDPDAVDLAFNPGIVPPKPIGKMIKRYPKIAREAGVEAVLNVEILITAGGTVGGVRVLGISLSKSLPPEIHASIAKAFSHDAVEILKGIRFTPPVVQGKLVPVRFEMPLRFRLEE